MINVIQHSRVSPPPGAVADQFLPLTFFDLMWIPIPPVQKLLFYDFRHSKSHFTDSLIPLLKHTLSLTLKHFFPLASNLILPSSSNPSKPKIRYVDGDFVPLTFAESSNDYNYLTGNQPRNADQFSPLVPKLMQEVHANNVVVPLAALQVTLFPESAGICFGFNYHHVLADGKAFQGFMKAWASITKFGSDVELLAGGYLPSCDRTMIRDRIGLEKTFLSQVCGHKIKHEDLCHQTSNNNVRATFVIARTDVQRLKELVMSRPMVPLHVSTFTVTCAYMWVCSLKSRASTKLNDKDDDDDDDELEHFVFPMDCRERLDPPILATYFGNCITFCFATARHSQLMEEEEGFFVAAKSIGEAVATKVHNGEPEGVLKGLETWLSQIGSLKMDRVSSVAGSPKLRHYEPDFGWGRPRKNEIVSIDRTGFFSMSECRDSQGDVEFGVCYPKITMDAFASFFVHGLKLL